MGYSIEVDNTNFNSEVVEKSHQQPVIVDFFGTWCGPCQLLKPILEKLCQEYDFILAKIDIDKNKELSHQFKVEGVPDVRIIIQGKVYPGFVGALSEPQIRSLLVQLNLKSELELGLEAIKEAIASKNYPQAKQLFDQLFTKYPEQVELTIEAARFLMDLNRLDEAEKLLKTIQADNREFYPQAQVMQGLIELQRAASNPGETELDQLFSQAANLTLDGEYAQALELFLKIVETNRKYRDDGARKAMLTIFNLLGMTDPLTRKYQDELMLVLY